MAKDSVELTSVHYRMRMVTSVSLQCPVKSWQRLLWKVLKNSHQSQPSWLHEGEILLVKSNFLLLRVTLVLQILELRYKKKKKNFIFTFLQLYQKLRTCKCLRVYVGFHITILVPHFSTWYLGLWNSGLLISRRKTQN